MANATMTDYTRGKLFPMILKFSIPAAVSLLISAIYNIVDRMFVGNFVGTSALAGLSILLGLWLSVGGSYLKIFLSVDKITAETIRYGNTYLYVDLAMYLFLGFIFVVRNCVQGIGESRFILGAGTAELAGRVAVCLVLPALLAGGEVSAAAPRLAFYALCAADPAAWIAADAVLMIPFLRDIMRKGQ